MLGLSWLLSGCMVSLNTCAVFTENRISIRRSENGEFKTEEALYVRNIACQAHGFEIHKAANNVSLLEINENLIVSPRLESWFLGQTRENRTRVSDKIEYACEKRFVGGEPLFKKLNEKFDIWEIRFDAFPGGTIRILYKTVGEFQYLLEGFCSGQLIPDTVLSFSSAA